MEVIDRRHSSDIVLARRAGIRPGATRNANRGPLDLDILPPQRLVFSLIPHPIPSFPERMFQTASILLLRRRAVQTPNRAQRRSRDRIRIEATDAVGVVARPAPFRRRTGPNGDLLVPSFVGTKGGGLRKRSGLIGDEGAGFFLVPLRPGGVFLPLPTVDGTGTRRAGSVVEDGGLCPSVEPHGRAGGN